jgi:hypothetical protein
MKNNKLSLLKKLNKQESRFTEEYIRHGDRVRAWNEAYKNIEVDERRIYNLATQLIKAPHIRAELKQYLTESEIKYGVSKAMLIAELKNIAFFDIASIMDEFGNFKGVNELKNAGRAITEIYVNRDSEGNEQRKVKVANKLSAIEALNKMMGYNAPEEHRLVDGEGNDVQPMMTVEFKKFTGGQNAAALPPVNDEDESLHESEG